MFLLAWVSTLATSSNREKFARQADALDLRQIPFPETVVFSVLAGLGLSPENYKDCMHSFMQYPSTQINDLFHTSYGLGYRMV
jgi:hypothetical protein